MNLHIGIIPDGNRRYAKHNDIPIKDLYTNGYKKLKEILFACRNDGVTESMEKDRNKYMDRLKTKYKTDYLQEHLLDISYITFYTCSKDNLLKRPKEEIDIIHGTLESLISDYKTEDIPPFNLQIVGDISLLPPDISNGLVEIVEETNENLGMYLTLAIGYDGREEIKKAFAELGQNVTDDLLREKFGRDIDIVIRTGYEKRMSSFFPWQTVYAEWYFLDKFWPEFEIDDLVDIIAKFKKTERRFGK